MLSETARGNSLVQKNQRKARKLKHISGTTAIKVDKSSGPYFSKLCLKILELIDRDGDSDTKVKIAAISSLETLAKEYPSDNPVYSNCLATIIDHIGSDEAAVSSVLLNSYCGLSDKCDWIRSITTTPINHEKYNANITSDFMLP